MTPMLAAVIAGATAGFAITFLAPWLESAAEDGRSLWPGFAIAALGIGLVALAVCGLRALLRPAEGRVIELDDTHAVLPLSSESKRSKRVPYTEIRSLNAFGRGDRARLLVQTAHRNFVYPAARLEGGANALAELRTALRARIAAQPGGEAQLEALDARDARAASVLREAPRVTVALLGLLVAIYAWTYFAGALSTPFGLVAFGANVPVLVEAGEWYRLLTANFLHLNLLHIYFNGFGLLVLGLLLERLLGPWRFLTIFLTTAAAGAATSAYASGAVMSVGASTAVFGLLGALGYVNWRFRSELPGGFAQPLRWWVIILGINALLPVVVPMIDWAAHAGGFAAGVVVAAAVCRERGVLARPHAAGPGLRSVTIATLLVYVLALGEAAEHAGPLDADARERVLRAFVTQPDTRPAALNRIAWQYATAADATRSELALAEDAARRAVDAAPDNDSFVDTLATVRFRQGELDAAIETQRRAVERGARGFLVSQLGRFLAARLDSEGPYTAGAIDATRVRVALADAAGGGPDSEAPAVVVELPHDVDAGLELIALDRRGGELAGTLRIFVGAGTASGRHRVVVESPDLTRERDADASLTLAYADAAGCGGCAPGRLSASYVAMDPEVARLP